MIPWPSISAGRPEGDAFEPVDPPSETTELEFMYLEELQGRANDASGSFDLFPEAAETVGSIAAPPARRRLNVAVLATSLTLHAAAIAGFGVLIAHEGMEAETDAISVEIVIEPAPEPAAGASVSGDANETRDAGAPVQKTVQGAVERPAETAEPVVAEAEAPPTGDPAEALLPQFAPLPPLTEIETAREQEDTPAPDEAASGPKIDVATAPPDFSPLPPLAGSPVAPAAPQETTERQEATEPVLAIRPALESMLPAIKVPPPPRFPPSAEARPAEPVPVKKEAPAGRKTVEQPTASKKPDKAVGWPRTRKAEIRPALSARSEKPGKSKVEAGDPAGGAKAKGKSQQVTRAGSVASAASSGDRDSYGRKVNSHVERYKRYPDAAARGGMKGAVKVSISIGGSGNLASARVTASSGYPVLDGEALATVRRAAPYPKPPAELAGTARFSLTLRYSK